eukprot:8314702-Alexandrium_andersonii.AAC.1
MSRGRQARFACRQCGRSTMASSYWCLRCGTLLRHCSCPRLVPSGRAGRPAEEPGKSRHCLLYTSDAADDM